MGLQTQRNEVSGMTHDLLLAILGGGNLILFVKFLIERHDRKKERAEDDMKESFQKKLTMLEKDVLRTQQLLLILMKPTEHAEILRISEHYFKDLHGNWYMTSIFNKWLEEENIAEPDWFNKGE